MGSSVIDVLERTWSWTVTKLCCGICLEGQEDEKIIGHSRGPDQDLPATE
jgi:hypothetical protein